MKKQLTYLLFCLAIVTLQAQQEQQFTQYFVNPYTINPAVGGTEDYIDLKVGGRYQWLGLEGAPQTAYFTAHTSLGKEFHQYHRNGEHKSFHGVGGYAFVDKTGPIFRRAFNVSYAYNFPITRKTRLSVGAFGGFKVFGVDGSYWNFINGEIDFPEGQTDPDFYPGTYTTMVPDLSFGYWLYNKNYYFGGSIYQLLGNNVFLQDANTALTNSELTRHYFVNAGIRLPLAMDIDLVPSMMVKKVQNAPFSVDLNAKFNYKDDVFAGFSYRVLDAPSAFVGVVLYNQIELSYSLDLTHTALRKFNYGSHEVVIGYRLKHPKHVTCASKYW